MATFDASSAQRHAAATSVVNYGGGPSVTSSGYAQGRNEADTTSAFNAGYALGLADAIAVGAGLVALQRTAAIAPVPAVSGDPDVVDHVRSSLHRLCFQFRSDDEVDSAELASLLSGGA